MNNLMTVQEASAYLNLNVKTTYRLAAQKKLPFMKVGGLWRIDKNILCNLFQVKNINKCQKLEQIEFFKNIDNCIFEGDCLNILKKIPDRSVDMILCDLPYGTTQNKWDSVIDLSELWSHYERIIKENGVIALTAQGIFTAKLILSNEKWFKYKMIWEKSKSTNFLNAKKQPLRKYEDICIFYNKQPTYNPQMSKGMPYNKGARKKQLTGSYGDFSSCYVKSETGDRYPNDILYFKTAESEKEHTVWHPTQKPVELGRYLIRTYTNPGDIVLDNAFGSGSFLLAAALENRRFCGIEKNKEVHLFKNFPIDYIEVANNRLKTNNFEAKVFRYADL